MTKPMRNAIHGRKSTRVMLGGEKPCDCGCGRIFPRSKSSCGTERRFFGDDCQKRYRYAKAKKGEPTRHESAEKGARTAAERRDSVVRFRNLPYNRGIECATDELGRPCTCQHYNQCSECWEVGGLTKLEQAGSKHSKGICYAASRVNYSGSAISLT